MSHVSSNNPQGVEAIAAVPSPRPNAVARAGWPEIIVGLIAFASGGMLLAGQLFSILSSTAWPSPHCLLSPLCWVCGSRMIDSLGAGLDMTFGNESGQPTLTLAGFELGPYAFTSVA